MWFARLGFVLLTLGVAFPAAGEDKAAARQAYVLGSKYYDLNQFADALEAFKQAYWNYEDSAFLFNIAQCHRALGHKKEAIEFYRSYLRKTPDSPNGSEIQKTITELERAVDGDNEKAHVGRLPQSTASTGSGRAEISSAETAPIAPSSAKPSASKRAETPLWKRPWLWGLVGGLAAAGVAVGVGVGVGTQSHPPKADGVVSF
jgi:tetratricopeptide (TPR) repeat protein